MINKFLKPSLSLLKNKLLFKKNFSQIAVRRFEDKVLLITGGSTGIGRATCLKAVEQGGKVIIADINEIKAKETVSELNQISKGSAYFLKTDISKQEDIENVVKETIKYYGKLDVLINNAAIFIMKTIENSTREEWNKMFSTNELAVAMLTKSAIQYLAKTQGSIVNIASICGLIAITDSTIYSSNKAAVMQMTRNLALDLAKYKIRVNSICPGYTLTNALDQYSKLMGITLEQLLKPVREKTLLKREASPDEIANAILFLASSEASYITGTHLVVDGGYSTL